MHSNINTYEIAKKQIPQLSANGKKDKLKEQTDNFEAIILKLLLDKSIKSDNSMLPKDPGRDIYQSMLNEERSKNLSGHFGYSELLYNFLTEKRNSV